MDYKILQSTQKSCNKKEALPRLAPHKESTRCQATACQKAGTRFPAVNLFLYNICIPSGHLGFIPSGLPSKMLCYSKYVFSNVIITSYLSNWRTVATVYAERKSKRNHWEEVTCHPCPSLDHRISTSNARFLSAGD